MERGNDPRQDHRDPHRAAADAQRAGHALFERADLGQGMPIFKLHKFDPARQHFALFGQRHPGRQSVEQRHADGLFQLTDAAGERGLADMQRLGGSADVALFDDAQEVA